MTENKTRDILNRKENEVVKCIDLIYEHYTEPKDHISPTQERYLGYLDGLRDIGVISEREQVSRTKDFFTYLRLKQYFFDKTSH